MQAKRLTLRIVFFMSLLGTLWSLYLSKYGDPVANLLALDFFTTANWIPACDMCWYIRVIMFPLPIITGVALWKRDYKILHTILLLAIIGLGFSIYKYGIQYWWRASTLCDWRATTPCSSKDVEYFWFMSMAFFGTIAFSTMIILSLKALVSKK
jgi:disulfide bond formation protein DsbB